MEFNVGDIVTLKSGGPKMTVRTVPYEDAGVTKVKCVWFNAAPSVAALSQWNDLRGDEFVVGTLEAAK
jgi:uncharacterized protein YodC (DUF2158 family)